MPFIFPAPQTRMRYTTMFIIKQKTEPFFMADKSKGRRVVRSIFSKIYVWKHHLIYFLILFINEQGCFKKYLNKNRNKTKQRTWGLLSKIAKVRFRYTTLNQSITWFKKQLSFYHETKKGWWWTKKTKTTNDPTTLQCLVSVANRLRMR